MISKIAIGTVQFGMDYGISNIKGQSSKLEVQKILNFAIENGISLIDTAQSYGNSEKVIGSLNEGRFNIVTKINSSINTSKRTREIVENSLKRLGVKSIYGVLFHDVENAFQSPNAYSALCTLKQEGIIQKIGYSVYSPNELQRLISKYGLPDVVQIPFSHLDRRFEKISTDLKLAGVEIHSRSTFLQGLYFINPNDLSEHFKDIMHYLKSLRMKLPENNLIAGFLLNFVLSRSFIDKVVIGVNNLTQLKSNVHNLKNKINYFDIEIPDVSDDILIPSQWPKN